MKYSKKIVWCWSNIHNKNCIFYLLKINGKHIPVLHNFFTYDKSEGGGWKKLNKNTYYAYWKSTNFWHPIKKLEDVNNIKFCLCSEEELEEIINIIDKD